MIARLKNEAGTALVAVMVISVLIVSSMLWWATWNRAKARVGVQQFGTQQAKQLADSGIGVAQQWLGSPTLSVSLPPQTTAPYVLMSDTTTNTMGRYEVALYRTNCDASLIEAYATGYYYVGSGPYLDPLTHQNATITVLDVKFKLLSVTQYLFAVPNNMIVDAGSNFGNGSIYGQDITFNTGAQIALQAAYYTDKVLPSSAPANVTFSTSCPYAQPLSYAPNFGTLTESVRNSYIAKAVNGPLPDFAAGGTLGPGSGNSAVYYSSGDVSIATLGTPLVVSGVYVIYTTGNIDIGNSINPQSTNPNSDWLGLLAEKNIYVTAANTNDLELNGTFITNWSIIGSGWTNPTAYTLATNGSMAALLNISLGWNGPRQYQYVPPPPTLPLPSGVDVLQYNILIGKY
ncbi:MAG TPA: hypothetical protein VMU17_05055 [Elusimicrobiota bacterium]|nr:hypothetical protein [Elusimicrobiota bacterium]